MALNKARLNKTATQTPKPEGPASLPILDPPAPSCTKCKAIICLYESRLETVVNHADQQREQRDRYYGCHIWELHNQIDDLEDQHDADMMIVEDIHDEIVEDLMEKLEVAKLSERNVEREYLKIVKEKHDEIAELWEKNKELEEEVRAWKKEAAEKKGEIEE